jgi:hypothetical protein
MVVNSLNTRGAIAAVMTVLLTVLMIHLSSAVASAQCDVDKKTFWPHVTFVGEQHTQDRSIEVRKSLIQLATQGRINLTSEVFMSPDGDFTRGFLPGNEPEFARLYGADPKFSSLFGIESPLPYALATIYQYQKKMIMENGTPLTNWGYTMLLVNELPLLKESYTELKVKILSKNPSEELAKFLNASDAYFSDLQKRGLSGYAAYQDVLTRGAIFKGVSQATVRSFYESFHKNTVDLVNRKYLQNLVVKTPLPYYLKQSDLNNLKGRGEGENWLDEETFVNTRNRDFAGRVLQVLCKTSPEAKEFVVLVGRAHMAGVENYLKKSTGDRLMISEISSNDLEDYEKFKTLLLKWRG